MALSFGQKLVMGLTFFTSMASLSSFGQTSITPEKKKFLTDSITTVMKKKHKSDQEKKLVDGMPQAFGDMYDKLLDAGFRDFDMKIVKNPGQKLTVDYQAAKVGKESYKDPKTGKEENLRYKYFAVINKTGVDLNGDGLIQPNENVHTRLQTTHEGISKNVDGKRVIAVSTLQTLITNPNPAEFKAPTYIDIQNAGHKAWRLTAEIGKSDTTVTNGSALYRRLDKSVKSLNVVSELADRAINAFLKDSKIIGEYDLYSGNFDLRSLPILQQAKENLAPAPVVKEEDPKKKANLGGLHQ